LSTWLARNSSEATNSADANAPVEWLDSVSREVRRNSVVGTSSTKFAGGVHCPARELLKKAPRTGLSGCIHGERAWAGPRGRDAAGDAALASTLLSL
jgi:hypothetical protein